MQDLEANNIRTIYPAYSRGELNAYTISDLYQVDNPPTRGKSNPNKLL